MRTYSHSAITWALARMVGGSPATAALAAAFGAALPDLPAILKAAALWPRRSSMTRKQFCHRLFFEGRSRKLDVALHSLVLSGAALGISSTIRGPESRATALALGWVGHNTVDLLTHADHTRPQLWPLSEFRWQSPVSYHNPKKGGRLFTAAEFTALALSVLAMAAEVSRGAVARREA